MVCNDGAMIANEVELKDPFEKLGAQIIRPAAERTRDTGGATSTATILTRAIFAEGLRKLAVGASASDLEHGSDRGVKIAIRSLRGLSRALQSRREKARIAAVSPHNDSTVGELVAEALEKVGAEGVVSLEKSKTKQTQLEIGEKLFDRGHLLPYCHGSPEKIEAELKDQVILITAQKLSLAKDRVLQK